MKAIRIHEPTGISGLVYDEAPDPTLVFGDVLVKVAACGITHNELDYPIWTCRAGHQRTSIIPGAEVSGVIAALGLGTAGVAVGEEVFGLTDQLRDGTAAEYVAVEARNLAPKPRTADHVHAAAVPRAGLTAWQALFDHGKLANGHATSFTQPVERVPRVGRKDLTPGAPAASLARAWLAVLSTPEPRTAAAGVARRAGGQHLRARPPQARFHPLAHLRVTPRRPDRP